jgi:nucleoside phosphorylase
MGGLTALYLPGSSRLLERSPRLIWNAPSVLVICNSFGLRPFRKAKQLPAGKKTGGRFFAFTPAMEDPILQDMRLIAAALAEELETALGLCSRREKIRGAGFPLWTGVRSGATRHFLKLGVGPIRAAQRLERALDHMDITSVLVIGYGGALDPDLRQGDLVIVEHADMLAEETLSASWPLRTGAELCMQAQAAGLPVRLGATLTSSCIIGAPERKRLLFARFNAAIVDMETAALAQVAAAAAVPLDCVRAVSDEAADDFLAFLSGAHTAGAMQLAVRTLTAGGWLRRYSLWRERSTTARQSLRRFLACHMDRLAASPQEGAAGTRPHSGQQDSGS